MVVRALEFCPNSLRSPSVGSSWWKTCFVRSPCDHTKIQIRGLKSAKWGRPFTHNSNFLSLVADSASLPYDTFRKPKRKEQTPQLLFEDRPDSLPVHNTVKMVSIPSPLPNFPSPVRALAPATASDGFPTVDRDSASARNLSTSRSKGRPANHATPI